MIGERGRPGRFFTVLLGIFLLVCPAASWAAPTATDAELTSSSPIPRNILLNEPTQFLPVEDAYRLTPNVTNGTLATDWFIAPGYYLYQHRFSVSLTRGGMQPERLTSQYQPGQHLYDDYYQKELEVYYGATRVLTALPATTAASLVLAVESQGCADAGLCYPPRTQYVSVNLKDGTANLIDAPPGAANATQPPSTMSSTYAFATLVAFALLGGMILNLMPCVFPVLSIKVLSTTTAHLSAHSKHLHGIAYSGGIILSFVAIAAVMLALRSAGQAVGWGFQLQSPTFVAVLAGLFFIIAQSFSGHLSLGGRWMSLGQNLTTSSSMTGSFMTGVLATIVASPCTAPFMGTALGVALTQPPLTSLAIFATLGLGMALPFLALSWIPGLMEKLPAPGPWMNTFSQLLAFPLYATVIWLLWVLGRQTSIDHAIAVSLGILLLGFAIWLHNQSNNVFAKAIVILAVAGAISLSLAPQPDDQPRPWQPYSAARLEALRAAGKPVFVNLGADWCITCLANEKIALDSDTFRTALTAHGITYLKGDWTHYDAEITQLLNSYGRSGVPLYLYYDDAGNPARILPQLLSEAMVLRIFAEREVASKSDRQR